MEFKVDTLYVAKLLGEKGKFIIPEYQRPYRWGKDECETLWNDILGVFNNGENIEEYFLGSIVTYKNDKNELEIIDGQQRITTLTLLFRAFYECLKDEDEKAKGDYPKDFGKCIWEYKRDKGFVFEHTHLSSQVATEAEDKILKTILSAEIDKTIDKIENSNYFKSYEYFYQKLKEFQKLTWKDFCEMVLGNKLFVLLVVCDSQESAMTIFNTLNSRGLPLSTADILKNNIYQKIAEKEKFANNWKEIEEKVEESDNIKDFDFLFLQYMHIIRAENEDIDTTTQSVLNFFTKKVDKNDKKTKYYGAKDGWLYKSETMPFIYNLADFWINPKKYLSDKSSRYIDILNLFQNDTWKIFVSYLVWRNKDCFNSDTFNKNKFSKEFDEFLPKLIKFITLPFLNNNATTNTIKEIIFKMNVNLFKGQKLSTKWQMPTKDAFLNNTFQFDARKMKYILYLYAYIYNNFEEDINPKNKNEKLEVEHILPKQWQNANFEGWDKELHE